MKYAKEQLFKQTDFLKGGAYIYLPIFIARATNRAVVRTYMKFWIYQIINIWQNMVSKHEKWIEAHNVSFFFYNSYLKMSENLVDIDLYEDNNL